MNWEMSETLDQGRVALQDEIISEKKKGMKLRVRGNYRVTMYATTCRLRL